MRFCGTAGAAYYSFSQKYSMDPCEKHTHQPGHSHGLCGWTKSEKFSCKKSFLVSSQAVAVLTHWFCLHVLYTSSLNIANDKNEEMKILHAMTIPFTCHP